MSSPNNPQDPYGSPEDPDRSSGSTSSQGFGSTPPAYGSTPPAYGSQAPSYGSQGSSYGSQPDYGSSGPAYGGGYGGSSPYGQPGAYGYPKNSLGVWALVLGLVGFFFCGPIAAIPAIILGSKSRKAAANGEANNGGLGLAGLILGWVTLAFWILALVWLFAFGGMAWYLDTLSTTTGTTTSF